MHTLSPVGTLAKTFRHATNTRASFSKRLRITVTNHDEPIQQANVTVYGVPDDPAIVYYQLSDLFGRVTFRLKSGVYKILVQHDTFVQKRRKV